MKSTALLLVAMLAGSQVVHADPAKIVDWPGGVASVRSHGPDGGLALGRIEADGTLVLEWPEPPASGQTLDQTFGACSGEGGLSVGPLDVGFTPTSIYAERDGKELGALHLATSPAVVAWRDSFAQKDAAVGAWLQWVHVTAQSEIAGDCTATVFTDPAATQSSSNPSCQPACGVRGGLLAF